MRTKVKSTRIALALAFVLALAGSAPAWSQSLIWNGLSSPADANSSYSGGYQPAPFYQAPNPAPERGDARHRHP